MFRAISEIAVAIAIRSTITPRDRYAPTRSARPRRRSIRSSSASASWTDAIRTSPCLRIGTGIDARDPGRVAVPVDVHADDAVAEEPLRLLDTTLQVADRLQLV